MKRIALPSGLALLVALPLAAQPVNAYGEWRTMGHDIARTNYTPDCGYIVTPVVKWMSTPPSINGDGSCIAGDVNGDGIMEVGVNSLGWKAQYWLLDGLTGDSLWGVWHSGPWNFSTPILADVDGDGADEMVDMWYSSGGGGGTLDVLNTTTGAVEQTRAFPGEDLQSALAAADVNADGVQEIILKGPSVVYALDGTNIATTVWQTTVGGGLWDSPSIADADADGALEVVVHGAQVYRLAGATGAIEASATVGPGGNSAPTLAQLDADPQLEIIVATGSTLRCLDGLTMTEQWNYPTGATIYGTAAVADVDGDGQNEVVFGSSDNVLYCLNADGTLLWSWAGATDNYFWVSPVALGDLTLDGVPEVVTANWDDWIRVHNGTDGGLLWSYSQGGGQPNNIAIADIDGDACLEVLTVGKGGNQMWAFDDTTDPSGCNTLDVGEGKAKEDVLRVKVSYAEGGALLVVSGTALPVAIRIYDASGRIVRAARGKAGDYRFVGLNPGAYVARVTAGEQSFGDKFAVWR